MDMKLVEDTLFVNMDHEEEVGMVKARMFALLNEYDIHNIVLHIINSDFYDSRKLNAFIHSFRFKNDANFTIK